MSSQDHLEEASAVFETARLGLLLMQPRHAEVLRREVTVFIGQFGLSVAEGAVVLQLEGKNAQVTAEWDRFLIIQRTNGPQRFYRAVTP